MRNTSQKGFTLIELMITVGILAIILGFAIPSLGDFFDKKRLIAGTEAVYSQLAYARTEAIARSDSISVTFRRTNATDWDIGMRAGTAGCTPATVSPTAGTACMLIIDDGDGSYTDTDDNVLKVIRSTEFAGANFNSHPYSGNTPANTIIFDGTRGTVTGGSNTGIVFRSNDGYELQIRVSVVGRVKICSPAGTTKVTGYKDCVND